MFDTLLKKVTYTGNLDSVFQELGFTFIPQKQPLYTRVNGEEIENPFHDAVVRTDLDYPIVIGSVGKNYQVIPYHEAFEFIRPLVGDDLTVYSGGVINNGGVAFCIFRTNDVFSVSPDDNILSTFVLSSSHNGTKKVEAFFAAYREKMSCFMPTGTKPIGIRHTKNSTLKLKEAQKVFTAVKEEWNSFEDSMKKMISIKMPKSDVEPFLIDLYGESKRVQKDIETVINIFYGKMGYSGTIGSCKDTVFSLYQAVVEYEDCFKKVRRPKKNSALARTEDDIYVESRLIGTSAKKKAEAYASIMSLLA